MSASLGVPVRRPLESILSHAGPETRENVTGSPLLARAVSVTGVPMASGPGPAKSIVWVTLATTRSPRSSAVLSAPVTPVPVQAWEVFRQVAQ